jgi:hypothetical protein
VKTSAARKGDYYESQVLLPYLRDQFGPQVVRPRTSGEHETGDFGGIPGWTFQAKCYGDMLRGIRDGLAGLERQMAVTGTPYGGLIVKRVGKAAPERQLFVMELDVAVPVIRETARWEATA